MLALVCVASPAFGPPQAEAREIRLPRVPTRPCIAIPASDVRIVVAMADLDALIARRPATKWRTETQRMALIDGDRAALLHAAADAAVDVRGCRLADVDVDDDAIYLVGKLLHGGRAAVVDARTGRAFERIHVLVDDCVGCPIAGESFRVPGANRPFLHYITRVM